MINSVRLYGSASGDCGYCKGERSWVVGRAKDNSSKVYTVEAERMEPSLYEDFMHRGWRRSGTCVYRQDNWQSCCPAITIRLPVGKFVPTKSQRKVLRKMETVLSPMDDTHKKRKPFKQSVSATNSDSVLSRAFKILQETGVVSCLERETTDALKGILLPSNKDVAVRPTFKVLPRNNIKNSKTAVGASQPDESPLALVLMTPVCAAISGRSKGALDRNVLSEQLVNALGKMLVGRKVVPETVKEQQVSSLVEEEIHYKRHRTVETSVSVQGIDRHAASGQVFVHLEVPRLLLDDTGIEKTELEYRGISDALREWWNMAPNDRPPLTVHPPYQLTVKTLPAHESALDPDVHQLYWNYQKEVHGDAHPLTDALRSGSVTGRRWGRQAPEGWVAQALEMLAKQYGHLSQIRQHHMIDAFISFYDFLVASPLGDGKETGGSSRVFSSGTYHQQYRLSSGLLIAVGVVDLLPNGVSSVYLYYDNSFSRSIAPLGKYAILREIEWTRDVVKLPYYYLGYYIESCQKMRYKADYHPSELLCPVTYQWVDAEAGKARLKERSPIKHCCALVESNVTIEKTAADGDLNMEQMKLDILEDGPDQAISFSMLTSEGQDLVRPLLTEFVNVAGYRIACSCIVDLKTPA